MPNGALGDAPCTFLDEFEVGRTPRTHSVRLGRGVDRDKDHIRTADTPLDIGREGQVPTSCLFDDLLEPRFVDR